MSETNHKVNIELLGDASKLEKELKEATSEVKSFQKQADKIRKADARSAKEVDKVTRKVAKGKRHVQKQALDLQQKLTKSIKQTTREVRASASVSNGQVRFDKAKVELLDKQTKALTKLSKQRKKLEQADARAKRSGRGGGGGFGGQIGKDLRSAAGRGALAVAGGMVYGAARTVTQDVSARGAYEVDRAKAQAFGGMSSKQSDSLLAAGEKNAYSPQEVLQQSAQLLTTTGSAKVVTEVLPEIMKLARSTGVDAGAFQGIAGTMTRGGDLSPKKMRDSIAAGMVSGLKKGRLTEYLGAVDGLLQQQQQISTANSTGAGANNLMAALGSTGVAGLQGARGAGVATQMNNAIRNPQGEAAEMMILQAVGMGSSKSYVQAKEAMQEGILSDETGMDTLRNVFKRIEELGGGNSDETALLGSEALNLSIRQFKDVRKALAAGGSDEEIRKKIKQVKVDGQPPEEAMVSELKTLVGIQHSAITRTKDLSKSIQELQTEIDDLKTQMMELLVPQLKLLIPKISSLVDWMAKGYAMLADRWGAESKEENLVGGASDALLDGGLLSPEQRKALGKRVSRMNEEKQGATYGARQGLEQLGILGPSSEITEGTQAANLLEIDTKRRSAQAASSVLESGTRDRSASSVLESGTRDRALQSNPDTPWSDPEAFGAAAGKAMAEYSNPAPATYIVDQ